MRDKQTDNNQNEQSFKQKHREGKRGREGYIQAATGISSYFWTVSGAETCFYVTLNKATANELTYQNVFEMRDQTEEGERV